jgi:hypothetical protein
MWYLNKLHHFRCNWHTHIWRKHNAVCNQLKWGKQMCPSWLESYLVAMSELSMQVLDLCAARLMEGMKSISETGGVSLWEVLMCKGKSLQWPQPSMDPFHQPSPRTLFSFKFTFSPLFLLYLIPLFQPPFQIQSTQHWLRACSLFIYALLYLKRHNLLNPCRCFQPRLTDEAW